VCVRIVSHQAFSASVLKGMRVTHLPVAAAMALATAGATGGTLLHGLGLGSKEAEKFLGITIQPEKDVILILAPQAKKARIMEEITHEAGLNTTGRGICFSLPVNTALGLINQD